MLGMAAFPSRVVLGRSGLEVCPLAVSGGMGVDARSLRRALDRGANYWYHGSLRRAGMSEAVRELVAAGRRDELVIVLQSYSRFAWHLERSVARGLRQLGIDHADVLLLGMYNKAPGERILERVARMREQGMYRHLAISSHHRPAFVAYAADPRYSTLHIRYNAAHPGAEADLFPHVPAANRPGIVAYTATSWAQLLQAKRMPPGEAPLRASDCYRFVLSNPDFNVCMTGPKNAEQMDEALRALEAGPLSPEENERIRRIGLHVSGKAAAKKA
jgi:aryl-alcohol dehydrogenase-like predicted oxidoreductase